MQEADLLACMLVVVVRFGGGKFALDPAQLGVAIEHEFQCGVGQRRRVLGDVGQHPARRHFEVAAVGVQLAAQQGEEG